MKVFLKCSGTRVPDLIIHIAGSQSPECDTKNCALVALGNPFVNNSLSNDVEKLNEANKTDVRVGFITSKMANEYCSYILLKRVAIAGLVQQGNFGCIVRRIQTYQAGRY